MHRRRGDAGVGAATPLGHGHAEVFTVDRDRGDDHVARAGEHEIEEIVVDHPDQHRRTRRPRLEHERRRTVRHVEPHLDHAVVAHTFPHAPAAHEHDRAGEPESRARVPHERRHHVVGTDGTLELRAEIDQALELGPAVTQACVR